MVVNGKATSFKSLFAERITGGVCCARENAEIKIKRSGRITFFIKIYLTNEIRVVK